MKDPNLFYQSIYEDYERNPNKNLILMAGPSSSGKGYESKKLAEYFKNKGKNVIVIEADNYYKGMSRTIVEKALMKEPFTEYAKITPHIIKVVRHVIESSDFSNKFCDRNCSILSNLLEPIFYEDTKAFVDELKCQKDNMNFDEPFAINFEDLANDINTLVEGGSIKKINYSFDTSESTYSDEEINAENNDVVIVEGLYALRDELLDRVDYDNTIRCGINCNIKSLMSRRFDRDIRGGRSTFTPGQTMESFICTVMPAYFRYIKPTMIYADHVLDASLTPQELGRRTRSNQIKFQAPQGIEELLDTAKLLKQEEQVDYFLEDDYEDSDITLRIRSNNDLVNQICLKAGQKLSDRSIDAYDVASALPPSKRNKDYFIRKLMKAGFYPTDMLRKTRSTYSLNGIEFNLDDIDGLGQYIEVESARNGLSIAENQARVEYLRSKLCLDSEEVKRPYREIKNEHLIKENKKETERKYKLEMFDMDFEDFVSGKEKEHIIQYYLDMTDEKVQNFLNTSFGGNIKFGMFAEARIRIIDGKRAYLTLKSRGSENRTELEKEIPVPLAVDYSGSALSFVSKDRYSYSDKNRGLKLEVDDYESVPNLRIVEVEYDPEKETEESVRDFVTDSLGDFAFGLTDVTNLAKYKNKNLAKDMSM